TFAQVGDEPLVLRAGLDDALRLPTAEIDPQAAAGCRWAVGARPAPVDPSGHLAERRQRLRNGALEPAWYDAGQPAEPRASQTAYHGARVDARRAEAAVRDAVAAQREKSAVGEPVHHAEVAVERSRAMIREEHHRGARGGGIDEALERLIEGDVEVADDVLERPPARMRGMLGIHVAPEEVLELVQGVRHHPEEVPLLVLQEVERLFGLD